MYYLYSTILKHIIMSINYSGVTIASMTLVQKHDDGSVSRFRLDLRRSNCFCCIIGVQKMPKESGKKQLWKHSLVFFAVDESHMKRICKADPLSSYFFGDLVNIKFNLYYPESSKILKYFVTSGYKVSVFYKAPKK